MHLKALEKINTPRKVNVKGFFKIKTEINILVTKKPTQIINETVSQSKRLTRLANLQPK